MSESGRLSPSPTLKWSELYYIKKVKVKVTLVQALRICTGRTAHRGSRGIAVPFHDHGTRRGWRVSVTPRSLFTPGKDPVPIVQEAGWAPGPVSTGVENLGPTGIRFPNRPARSQSLCRLRYPAQELYYIVKCTAIKPAVRLGSVWNWTLCIRAVKSLRRIRNLLK